MRVGVVGANGFIGKHVCLGLLHEGGFDVTKITKEDCVSVSSLSKKTINVETLVIAGGVNRSDSEDFIYAENIRMVETIIETLREQDYKGRVIFLSSIQNILDSAYGRSKRDSETRLKNFSNKNGVDLHILVLPNIFGESQKTYYNSVVPTFIHQILKDKPSQIADAQVELLHVRHIVALVKDMLSNPDNFAGVDVRLEGEMVHVKKLHQTLKGFCGYEDAEFGIIPEFPTVLHKDLFNTFRYMCWELQKDLSGNFLSHGDNRGELFELVRTKSSGQIMFSTTKPDSVRGGHFHTRKIERFCLLTGHSEVVLESLFGDFSLTVDCSSDKGTFVDIPNYTVHRLRNVGNEDVMAAFWINEIYNPNDGDTYGEITK